MSQDLNQYYPNINFGNNVQMCGIKNIFIGEKSCIGDDVWLNVCQRDEKIRIRIGERVLVGRRGVINTGGFLEIGSFSLLGPNVYVGDADHIYTSINTPLIGAGVGLNRSVIIEENCWLAMNSVISGNLTIGRGSVVGANSVVTSDVPPFSVVVGNPSKIVKLFDPIVHEWVRVKTQDDIEIILDNRKKNGIMNREEYKKLLRLNLKEISSVVVGKGQHLL